jgi:hypothetical protein
VAVSEDAGTPGHVDVRAARIPDRDRLLRALQDAGLDAKAVGELAIEVICEPGEDAHASDEIYARAEELIESVGAAFIPIKHDGVIYIRPPVG